MLAIMIYLRLIYIMRTLLVFSEYESSRGHRITKIYGCEATLLYSMKMMMKDRIVPLILWLTIATLVINAYTIRLFE